MIKIVTFVANDNRIYQTLGVEGEPVQTLVDSRLGPTIFNFQEMMRDGQIIACLQENDEGRADDRPPLGGMP